MEVRAKLRYLRIAPRKVRLVADLIRRKSAREAEVLLSFCRKRAALPLLKLLRSALANAKNNLGIDDSNLYISKITVDEGPKLKRWRARARGQAFEIQKKTSHITLILSPKGEVRKEKSKEKKKEKGKKPSSIRAEEPKEAKKKSEKIIKAKKPEKELPKPRIQKITPKIFRRKAF